MPLGILAFCRGILERLWVCQLDFIRLFQNVAESPIPPKKPTSLGVEAHKKTANYFPSTLLRPFFHPKIRFCIYALEIFII